MNSSNEVLTMTLSSLLSAALAVSIFAGSAQAAPLLHDGVYQAPEGVVLVEVSGTTFTVTDPELPALQIIADTSGACSLLMPGMVLPCTAQVSPGRAVVTIPALETTIPMTYLSTVDQYLAAQQYTAPTPQYSSSDVEVPTITYDGMGNMDGTVTITDGGMSYDY